MSLAKIVSFVEDGPWCGTKPPGFHPPRPHALEAALLSSAGEEAALNPQPLPPRSEIAAFLWQAVRLYQQGQQLKGVSAVAGVGESLVGAAQTLYDDGQCGSVPWRELLRWLGHPPPPPPPWVDMIGQAVGSVLIGARMGGEFGKQLQAASVEVIHQQLGTLKAG